MLLSGRVAIITGGSRGIGKGIALKFAEEDASVVIADIREVEGENTVEEIINKGGNALFMLCDVTDSRQIQAMVNRTINKCGKVDILVNNAGIGPLTKSIIEIPEEEWDRIFEINIKSMFLCCKAVASHMKEKQYGRIINVSSLSAILPRAPKVHYSASKGGILAFTIDIALELAPYNICVNAILPGMIRTDLTKTLVPHGADKDTFFIEFSKNIPSRRIGTPEDVGGAALFLASELSSYVTANQIIVAGGLPYSYTHTAE